MAKVRLDKYISRRKEILTPNYLYQEDLKISVPIIGLNCSINTLIWIDYFKSHLSGIAYTDVTKLPCVQNQLALVVRMSPSVTAGVSLLCSLHWLPVNWELISRSVWWPTRLYVKNQPVLFHSMLATSPLPRPPGSNIRITLLVPRLNTKTGERAFHSCAPSCWYSLPLSVRSVTSTAIFRKRL